MASETQIANLALQKLGDEGEINSLADDTRAARAVAACFGPLRDALLRDHVWDFARARASLPALTEEPAWGGLTAFQKPADFLRFVEEEGVRAYLLEGDQILAPGPGPLNILYIRRVEDTGRFDSLFVDALATRIAVQVCLQLTGSNSTRDRLAGEAEELLRGARCVNGREDLPRDRAEDDWILAREGNW